jgi:hypothetical protein
VQGTDRHPGEAGGFADLPGLALLHENRSLGPAAT